MIRMPIGSGASRPHRAARDRRNGARNASESLPAIPRITQIRKGQHRWPRELSAARKRPSGRRKKQHL